MNRLKRNSLFEKIKKELENIPIEDIENGTMCFCLDKFDRTYDEYCRGNSGIVFEILERNNMSTDFETIIEFFGFLINNDVKVENGVVFTPKYISDYIVEAILEKHEWNNESAFIDPGCGGGIFLISAAEILRKKYKLNIDEIIEKYIYGIDIDEDNVRRCILVLKLLSAKYGGDFTKVNCNVQCCDSLKTDWASKFKRDQFTFVIGNPPYVNPHDMQANTIQFLKNNFETTKTGVFNIFYAFIEHAMTQICENGVLGYIVPNNFLTIKSAVNLRWYLQFNKFLSKIIDFGNNMVFRPVRTYNCILFLEKKRNEIFKYCVMDKVEKIESAIRSIKFDSMSIDRLDKNSWVLVNEQTHRNLQKIESNFISIKSFIRTGIATLKDAAFMVEKDKDGYYKNFDGKRFYIEPDLIKPIYKIPKLKLYNNIEEAEGYIIFPYIKNEREYVLIEENKLKALYPLTYHLLLSCKADLDRRDKGKPNQYGWYAYGRTQGLNKYGKKLLFPTFSNSPKFMCVDNEDALFCNGYGIFENDFIELDVLAKILNSKVMDYYIKNTSYSIEGGFYCYQKKYIERFSIPCLQAEQSNLIRELNDIDLDDYLWNLYNLE